MNQNQTPQNHSVNALNDVLKDPIFTRYVKDNLEQLIRKRRDRPEPQAGFRYKRDWYDAMEAKGMLNVAFFIDNIEAIWLKKSRLSSQERNVIDYVCSNAAHQTERQYIVMKLTQDAKDAKAAQDNADEA